ncbi:uncharacterized protein SETTUDRAFT_25103 [Exserohilum turcica Et28A]|uniref:WAP domain-containing protein n=1 Tax=Exserohilum turcicum (strain 28A) TaxID=671987 RepID=R0KPQ0_EXST2|nr:uncharacterized protein SETTUDRAFT_25103 [Exserohilum turcica Et28A]EOA91009.1 hypothetical protein SETTUDRAFT_25103 [Exserohilum turcica Et28A]
MLVAVALVGLLVLVNASPTVTDRKAVTGEQPSMSTQSVNQNNEENTYHCDDDPSAIACPAMDDCSAQGPLAIAKRDTPDTQAQENKRYECSKDHTGVLICRYGFCSTDHYCKKNTKCSDKCACCKKGRDILRDIGVFKDSSA